MRLLLKYAQTNRSGNWQYRRRVPKEVSTEIVQREFKFILGATEKAALAAYPMIHARVERQIVQAKQRIALQQAAHADDASELEAYAEAKRYRKWAIQMGADETTLQMEGEHILDAYPTNEDWEPIGVTTLDYHKASLLRLGPKRHKAPEPTLEDARKIYLKERFDLDDPATDLRAVNLVNRVIAYVTETLGHTPILTELSRDDARTVRDEMLDRVKVRGRGVGGTVSPATVSRELSIIAAVINFAAKEFDLPGNFQNPFNDLPVTKQRKGETPKASEKRDPLPPSVLSAVRSRVLDGAGEELKLIWRILEGTGCRIAEITGLSLADIDLTGELPHLRIIPNAIRRLKTSTSQRDVPLVGDALRAAQEALNAPREGEALFPSYGRPRGSDAASAALMKHIRAVSEDPKHVIHSLRHNMKDSLIMAEVSSLDQNLILGHALSGVGDNVYGGRIAKLRQTTKAMHKVEEIRLSSLIPTQGCPA